MDNPVAFFDPYGLLTFYKWVKYKADHWGISGHDGYTDPKVKFPVATCTESACGWKATYEITVIYTIHYNVDSPSGINNIVDHELDHVKWLDQDVQAFFQPLASVENQVFKSQDECAQKAEDAISALGGGPALEDYLLGNKKHAFHDFFDPICVE